MNGVQEKYQKAESSYGYDLLNLLWWPTAASPSRWPNDAAKSYIGRHEPEALTHLDLMVNTVSMEEAVQQQAEV